MMRSEKRKRFQRVICKCCSTTTHCDPISESTPKHRRSKRKTRVTYSLPPDIIEQVFLRLPAQSVVKLRLACKLFDQITTKPQFVSAHTHRCRDRSVIHRNPSPFTSTKLLFQRNLQPKGHLIGASGSHKISIKALQFPINSPCKGSGRFDTFVSSDDGLLCLCARPHSDRESLFFTLFNPLTGESFYYAPLRMSKDAFLIAFYYHEPSATYRALLGLEEERGMCTVLYFDHPGGEVRVRETTIKPAEPLYVIEMEEGVLLVQPYVFAFATHSEYRRPRIVVFDTRTERFTHQFCLAQGLFLVATVGMCVENKLIEIAGKLCAFTIRSDHCFSPQYRVKMWVLKDVEQGIWIKKERVVLSEFVHDPQQTYDVLQFMNNNLLLLVSRCNYDIASPEKEFNIYYITDRELKESDTSKVPIYFRRRRTMYCETLASVHMQH